jgi:hypothetical protein
MNRTTGIDFTHFRVKGTQRWRTTAMHSKKARLFSIARNLIMAATKNKNKIK